MRKVVATVALAILAVLPLHGEDKVAERSLPAVQALEDGTLKLRCAKAALALDRWSKRLKVQNWDIELVCDEYPQMPGAYGVTEMRHAVRQAKIWINVQTGRDPEEIAIHELLHIVMREASTSAVGEEQAVWTLTGLLWKGNE